jgi:O-antigen/teichoic acid export membrane protein
MMLVALGLLPFSLSTICEAIFQGWERMQYITYANLPRNLIVIAISYLFLSQGYYLNSIAWLLSVSYIFLVAIEWWLIFHYILKPNLKVDLKFSIEITTASIPFLGFQGTLAISNMVIFLILSKFSGETEVGYYNAAGQILVPLMLVIQNIVLSAYPVMCRRFNENVRGLKLLSDNLIELLLLFTVPMVIILSYLSDSILLLLYGNPDFILASGVLRLILFTLILRAVSSVLGRDLLAGHHERAVLNIVLVGSIVNIFSGLILIRQFGLIGAAITAIIFATIDFIFHYVNTLPLLPAPIPFNRLWKPLVAAGILIAFLASVKIQTTFLTAFIGGLIYIIVWVLISIWTSGSLKQLKLKYQILWSEL